MQVQFQQPKWITFTAQPLALRISNLFTTVHIITYPGGRVNLTHQFIKLDIHGHNLGHLVYLAHTILKNDKSNKFICKWGYPHPNIINIILAFLYNYVLLLLSISFHIHIINREPKKNRYTAHCCFSLRHDPELHAWLRRSQRLVRAKGEHLMP